VSAENTLALRELIWLFSRRRTRRSLENRNASDDTEVSILEEQSAVRLLEHWHIWGHKAVAAGDRNTIRASHAHPVILAATNDK
jgi:hypothetical protein